MADLSAVQLQRCLSGYTSGNIFQRADPLVERYLHLQGKHIPIEGNIGCGKSTLGAALADFLCRIGIKAHYHNERILDTLLASFYQESAQLATHAQQDQARRAALQDLLQKDIPLDQKTQQVMELLHSERPHRNTYALSMQLYMLSVCQNHHNEANFLTGMHQDVGTRGVVFTERAVFGNAVFAALQYSSGGMNELDYEIYKEALQSRGPYTAHCVLYLHVPVDVALHRIKRLRQRQSEEGIPAEYLQALETAYYAQIYHQMEANHSVIIVVRNDITYAPAQILDLICAAPPPFKFTPDDHPSLLAKPGQVGPVLLRMCDHYEKYLPRHATTR